MRRLLRILVLLVVLAAIGAGAIAWWSNKWLQQPIAGLQEKTTFEVHRGASTRSVATSLNARGLLDQPQVWVAWSRLTRSDGALKAGEYELQPGLTPRGLLTLLSSGQVLLHSITFIEGSTFADARNALVANEAVRNVNADRSDADIMRALGARVRSSRISPPRRAGRGGGPGPRGGGGGGGRAPPPGPPPAPARSPR